MTVTMRSTAEIVMLNDDVPARVWEGTTESGIKVAVLVTRIAAHKSEDLAQFERELIEQPAPSTMPRVFPLRMIL